MKKTMRKLTVAVGALLFATVSFAQDFSVRLYQPTAGLTELQAALDTVTSQDSQTAVAQIFQKKYPADVTVQTLVANIFAMKDIDAARKYYVDQAAQEPDNVAANYVAGRLTEKAADRRVYAEKMLAKDPNSYWGNLLLALSLMKADDPTSDQAESALRKAIAADNSQPPAVEELGKLLQSKGRTEDADRVFVKLGEMLPNKFGPVRYRMVLVAGDQAKAMKLVDDYLKKNPNDTDALDTKAAGAREMKDWNGYVSTMRKLVSVDRTGENSYNLACAFSLAGQPDSAYAWLNTAAELAFNDIQQYQSDEDLVPLHNDPRWSALLTKVEDSQKAELAKYMQQMASIAPQRKERALSERGTAMATEFTLKDLNGKTVSLNDLRGKVVILDFWATWCGPCKRTMPLLDKFYTDQRPKDVEIYGVNVWQREKTDADKEAAVSKFIKDSGYHFPILYGTSDLAKAYGVQGIPTMVVIDKQGKLAYRHVGYDPTIPEVLAWQTKELLK